MFLVRSEQLAPSILPPGLNDIEHFGKVTRFSGGAIIRRMFPQTPRLSRAQKSDIKADKPVHGLALFS